MSFWSTGMRFGRLFFEYRSYLRELYTKEMCERMLRERLNTREERFLSAVKRTIFENPASPYLPLLAEAHCTHDDLAAQVTKDGLDATLEALRQAGVYVSFEQFKYGEPLERGGRTFQFAASDFDNPLVTNYFLGSSGGTRSAGTPVRLNLDWFAERSISEHLEEEVFGTRDHVQLRWAPGPPAIAGLTGMVRSAKTGTLPDRWFSMIDRKRIRLSLQSRVGSAGLLHLGRLFGTNYPRMEYLPLTDAAFLSKLIADLKRQGRTTLLKAKVSCGVRVCQAALENGWDISGTTIYLSSEPATPRKVAEVKAAGAVPIPRYDNAEVGYIGVACPHPSQADDIHLFRDVYAVIQHDRRFQWGDAEIRTFLFTCMSPSAPKVLLNVEMDDCGIMETRKCGCGFERYGFTTHLHTIRSFNKLTGEGMNVMNRDFIRVFEEVLPSRYGGDSTDYQLVEEEDERGFTRVSILIHPRLGSLDENEVLQSIREELRKGEDFRQETRDFMLQMWSQAETLRIRREPPISTQQGKLFPFHTTLAKKK